MFRNKIINAWWCWSSNQTSCKNSHNIPPGYRSLHWYTSYHWFVYTLYKYPTEWRHRISEGSSWKKKRKYQQALSSAWRLTQKYWLLQKSIKYGGRSPTLVFIKRFLDDIKMVWRGSSFSMWKWKLKKLPKILWVGLDYKIFEFGSSFICLFIVNAIVIYNIQSNVCRKKIYICNLLICLLYPAKMKPWPTKSLLYFIIGQPLLVFAKVLSRKIKHRLNQIRLN